jgi:transposase
MPKPSSYKLPALTDKEWRAVEPIIPRPARGPQPKSDRTIIGALCYMKAAGCSAESLPKGYPPSVAIRTRLRRLETAGVMPKILDAAAPATQRIKADYWEHIRYLSFGSGWKFHRAKDDPELINLPRLTHCR